MARQDFDYVLMSDYRLDMKEVVGQASSAISYWKNAAEQAELMCALAVLAAGGKVEIPREWLYDPKVEVEHMRNDANLSHIIRVRRL